MARAGSPQFANVFRQSENSPVCSSRWVVFGLTLMQHQVPLYASSGRSNQSSERGFTGWKYFVRFRFHYSLCPAYSVCYGALQDLCGPIDSEINRANVGYGKFFRNINVCFLYQPGNACEYSQTSFCSVLNGCHVPKTDSHQVSIADNKST